jgi:RND family efflux transporter MFP subunit
VRLYYGGSDNPEYSMPKQSLNDLLHMVHKLAGQTEGTLADAELLARFVECRDEAAFEALVWRHGQLIWKLCERILRDPQDAEDAFQATFLVLARKADSVRERRALGGWLYQIAQRICLGMRRKKGASSTLPILEEPVAGGIDSAEQADLRRLLEEEIGRLPRKYRLPLLLRYIEGRSTEEAAAIIGCPRGTILSRLAWSRQRLRTRLAARGVGLSVALIAAAATESSAASAKSVLAAASTALLFLANPALQTTRPVSLAKGVLRTMLMTKVAAGSIGAIVVLTASVGLGIAMLPGNSSNAQAGGQGGVSSTANSSEKPVTVAPQEKLKTDEPAQANKQAKSALPVATFVHPVATKVGDSYSFVGHTEASQTIDIRPRITGTLEKVLVKPGSHVKKGDALFELDSSNLRAEAAKAAAEVQRAKAQVDHAMANLARLKTLVNSQAVGREPLDLASAKGAEAEAGLQAAQAQFDQAKLQLDATRIISPIDGRVGRIRVDAGNSAGQNTTLATIVSVSPIKVSFNMDEQSFRKLQTQLQEADPGKAPEIEMGLASENRLMHKGRIESVDNQFESGTIQVRALFPNKDESILPGMVARVCVTSKEPTQGFIIPARALELTGDHRFVYVISAEDRLETRGVVYGTSKVPGTLIIREGLGPKDRVVIDFGPPRNGLFDKKGNPVAWQTPVANSKVIPQEKEVNEKGAGK